MKILLLLMLVFFSLAPIVSAGPISELYLVAWQNGGVYVFQGNSFVRSWGTSASSDLAIAVNTTVRTAGYYYSSTYGAEYTLAGSFTGTTYPVIPSLGFHDGTTDGTYNYAISWHTQTVYRFNSNWSNGTAFFTPTGSNMIGITYDPTDNTMWLLSYGRGAGNNTIEHYTMAGTRIGLFSVASNEIGGLALDHADGTLWYWDYNSSLLRQYSKSGSALSTTSISGGNYWGAEFRLSAVPEFSSLFLVAMAASVLFFCRRR